MTTAIAITAHHDDAVLWCGGTILRTRSFDWTWTVVALCVPNTNTADYFRRYCADVKGMPATYNCRDYQEGPSFKCNTRQALEEGIMRACPNTHFDWVFTHSRDEHCEYGFHANHQEVREATQVLVRAGKLCATLERLVYFSYSPIYGGNGRATVARKDSDFYLQLTYDELFHKCTWCRKAPDALTSLSDIGFPCPNPEAFEGDGVRLPKPFIPGEAEVKRL